MQVVVPSGEHSPSAPKAKPSLMAALAEASPGNWHEVALKLAMWRWTGECLCRPESNLGARDRLVYSAFRDAVRLADRPELGTQTDRDCDFFADLLTDSRAA